jgi:hypothetical protein
MQEQRSLFSQGIFLMHRKGMANENNKAPI